MTNGRGTDELGNDTAYLARLGGVESCAAPLIDCARPELLVDDRVPAATRAKLREMGHSAVDAEVSFAPRVFAHPTGVTVDSATGLRYGDADPFSIGIAAGR